MCHLTKIPLCANTEINEAEELNSGVRLRVFRDISDCGQQASEKDFAVESTHTSSATETSLNDSSDDFVAHQKES